MTEDGDSKAGGTGGFLRLIVSDYKAFAALIGVLIYGVVRVAYDAFYARLGVFPEAVGLSETTILGRAALYLALVVSVAAIFIGLWLIAFGAVLERRARADQSVRWARWLLLATAVLPVIAVAIVAAAPRLRSLLNSNHLAYYCFQRCKFSALKPTEVSLLRGLARRLVDEHPNYSFVDFGPEWLVVLPVILLVTAALLGTLSLSVGRWKTSTVLPRVVIAVLAVAAGTAGLLAPHLIASSDDASHASTSVLDTHPWLVKWVVLALIGLALVAGLLSVLHRLVGKEPSSSPWVIASFVIILPLLLGFLAPGVMLFIEEEGTRALVAAAILWVSLFFISFRLWPHLRNGTVRPTAGLAILLALIVSLTLFLAWERGSNLAKRAAMGDQILVRGFSLLSVRSSVVCLEPTTRGTALRLPRRPYVYLGEADGTLVLYDYVTDLARDVPEAFPLRVPSSGIAVRVAHYNPGILRRWDCAPNS